MRMLEIWTIPQVEQRFSPERMESTIDSWATTLRHYDAATIRRAGEHLADVEREFPPNLSQFRALCEAHRGVAAHRPAQPYADSAPTDAKQLTMTDRSGERASLQEAVTGVDGDDQTRWIGKLFRIGPRRMTDCQVQTLAFAFRSNRRDIRAGRIPAYWARRYESDFIAGFGEAALDNVTTDTEVTA